MPDTNHPVYELSDGLAPQPQPPVQPKVPAWLTSRTTRILLLTVAAIAATTLVVFTCFYVKFARLTNEKLRTGVFAGSLNIFAEPRVLATGDHLSLPDTIEYLRENGYGTSQTNPVGRYEARSNAVAIFPGRDSGSDQEAATIHFSGDKVARIVSLSDNTDRQEYQLAPHLITNLSDSSREQRRLVRFSEIPPALVHAVISVEDKHFFTHSGFDLFRILKAAYVDVKDGRKAQGASTLSMQLARALWLEPDKSWKRKAEELLITMHLEDRLTKQQIFEYYSNEVYLGRKGPFSVNGFGEAAHAYFGKDLSQLNVSQTALLAGMVQRPSFYNPFRYPGRARERRNVVLRLMRGNRYLNDAEYQAAVASPIEVRSGDSELLGSQYFLDLVNDELQSRLGEREPQSNYVYTTLDMDLQRAAVDAVKLGMQSVDERLRKRKGHEAIPPGQPQVALIALDPHTGEIKALVGGRDYGTSQWNHVTAERQPGSAFKPFVYAAALDTAVDGGSSLLTPATTVDDEPTTFQFGGRDYEPGNFQQDFRGTVTLRQALAHSLNVAAVKVAEMVGYQKVVNMARRAGLNESILATPAVALGAYDTTPLEIAGAYTIFANAGTFVKPTMLAMVRSRAGHVIYQHKPETRQALDPRIAYLMVNMLEEVLRSGTAAGARSRGFRTPAAGKTGTSRDGWFAGFTSRLLCVVWVGFDDNRELKLEGAASALPIWTEFMKRAGKARGYRDAKEFPVPQGVSSVHLCAESGQLATPSCPSSYAEYFVDGSQPVVQCNLHAPSANGMDADRSSGDSDSGSFDTIEHTPRPPN